MRRIEIPKGRGACSRCDFCNAWRFWCGLRNREITYSQVLEVGRKPTWCKAKVVIIEETTDAQP